MRFEKNVGDESGLIDEFLQESGFTSQSGAAQEDKGLVKETMRAVGSAILTIAGDLAQSELSIAEDVSATAIELLSRYHIALSGLSRRRDPSLNSWSNKHAQRFSQSGLAICQQQTCR